MKFFENGNTQVIALGGLGEVGKNMYCIMHIMKLSLLILVLCFLKMNFWELTM